MKRIFRIVGMALLCGTLLAPDADARGRNENSQGIPSRTTTPAATRSAQPVSRPGNSGLGNSRPGNSGTSAPTVRPGNQGSQQPGGNKPTGNGTVGNNRPGNNPPGGNPPGGNRPNGNYPGGFQYPGGAPGGPIGSQRPNYHPAPPPHRPGAGPARPNMPPAPPAWSRPVPPPSWRPPTYWNPFRSILGIAFGTSINLSINSLIHNGYTVSQYGTNTVFVNNVPMLNMMWPDAVLYYNNAGGLCGSRFIYASGFYDMTRYNSVYASLVNAYGSPYSVQNTASGIEANWWGTGNQFITLSFAPQYTAAGSVAYYTTLSFGN